MNKLRGVVTTLGLVLLLMTPFLAPTTTHADVLPQECLSDRSLPTCMSHHTLVRPSSCRTDYYLDSAIFQEADKVKARFSDPSDCQGKVCNGLTYNCDNVNIFANAWFWIGLATTLISETILVLALLRPGKRKGIKIAFVANIATYVPLTLILVKVSQSTESWGLYAAVAIIMEILAVVAEAAIYRKVFAQGWRRSLVVSAIANAASVVIGIGLIAVLSLVISQV